MKPGDAGENDTLIQKRNNIIFDTEYYEMLHANRHPLPGFCRRKTGRSNVRIAHSNSKINIEFRAVL
jgi:hypothetical protein